MHSKQVSSPDLPQISIIVKALNEEGKIGACLTSAVAEARQLNGEVILVDSISEDQTVEIAKKFSGVRIVQFLCAKHRCCGAAVQLGFQYTNSEYIYILDGDMVLEPGFLAAAIDILKKNSFLAGVGGKIVDTDISTPIDAKRSAFAARLTRDVGVLELGGGGLYRRSAIDTVGYLGHRWLPAFEEAELGARLVASGWKLMRLCQVAVTHTGHNESHVQSLLRLWTNRRAHSHGMVLRASLYKPWGKILRRKMWYLFLVPCLHLLSLLLGILLIQFGMSLSWWTILAVDAALWTCLACGIAIRKCSMGDAISSILTWHWYAMASLIGALHSLPDPMVTIPSRVIR